MKTRINRLFSKLITSLLAAVLLVNCVPMSAAADGEVHKYSKENPLVVVSMGDSYSSGEGVPPFYGNKPENDWLAHRSQNSWPGKLVVEDGPNTRYPMHSYKHDPYDNSDYDNFCKWYFVASSGAVTNNFANEQKRKLHYLFPHSIPPQISVFDKIKRNGDTVDYVTMTIGGNDVGFSDIITTCVVFCSNLYVGKSPKLQDQIDKTWRDINIVRNNLRDAYNLVWDRIKPQGNPVLEPNIIVAGYPELLNYEGKGAVINRNEARIVNENVVLFNAEIKKIVENAARSGKNISYVDVVDEFHGHQAYSSDAWLNPIVWGSRSEDFQVVTAASSYSVHPNNQGTDAYARCVNRKIAELEAGKAVGTLSGKVCQAADHNRPVANAEIFVYDEENRFSQKVESNANGLYKALLRANHDSPKKYRVVTSAPGYLDFTDYAEVTEYRNTYLPVYLMIKQSNVAEGSAGGCITNAVTGEGIGGVKLTVRSGWNNTSYGDVCTHLETNANGEYIVDLPLGNYTLYAEKVGYVPTTINIVVQEGMSPYQSGTMTPVVSGEDFRIVLSWDENPRDLDSHMVGTLSDGRSFHVYFADKTKTDGDVSVCNLDLDDRNGFGPETTTLHPTTGEPYYYYVYKFYGNGTLSSSHAQVKVYQGQNLLGTLNVPTDLGDGDYWNIFAIVNGQLVMRNTITDEAETDYAHANAAMYGQEIKNVQPHPKYDDRYPGKDYVDDAKPTEEAAVPNETEAMNTPEEQTETASRKLFLNLAETGADYAWMVRTAEKQYPVTEETEGIYSVELPADTAAVTLLGEKADGTCISSEEISLADLGENNCLVPALNEQDACMAVTFGYYDSADGTFTAEPAEEPETDEKASEETVPAESTEPSEIPAPMDPTESSEAPAPMDPTETSEVSDSTEPSQASGTGV